VQRQRSRGGGFQDRGCGQHFPHRSDLKQRVGRNGSAGFDVCSPEPFCQHDSPAVNDGDGDPGHCACGDLAPGSVLHARHVRLDRAGDDPTRDERHERCTHAAHYYAHVVRSTCIRCVYHHVARVIAGLGFACSRATAGRGSRKEAYATTGRE
jgi:hypothetical protein